MNKIVVERFIYGLAEYNVVHHRRVHEYYQGHLPRGKGQNAEWTGGCSNLSEIQILHADAFALPVIPAVVPFAIFPTLLTIFSGMAPCMRCKAIPYRYDPVYEEN